MNPQDTEIALRQQLVDYANLLGSSGLSTGKSGNLSARCHDTLLITPTGVEYSQLTTRDIVALQLDGKPLPEQPMRPSSEWHLHRELYGARPEVHAVVHAHPPACTALACTGRSIPAFHYMVAIAGGKHIPLADYALFGTSELSAAVQAAIGDLNACLMKNHGMIAIGNTLPSAFKLAIEIENLAEQYWRALQLGDVQYLSDQQMDEVLEQFSHYGQRN